MHYSNTFGSIKSLKSHAWNPLKRLYVEKYRLIQTLCEGTGVMDVTEITDITDITDRCCRRCRRNRHYVCCRSYGCYGYYGRYCPIYGLLNLYIFHNMYAIRWIKCKITRKFNGTIRGPDTVSGTPR